MPASTLSSAAAWTSCAASDGEAVALVVDALKDCSKRRGIVLDPFVGSGTTLLAAEKTGRVGRAIELDPHYVDAAIGRWQALTGKAAVHVETGKTFNELALRRPAPQTPREGKKIMSTTKSRLQDAPRFVQSRLRQAAQAQPVPKGQVGQSQRSSQRRKNQTYLQEMFLKPVTVLKRKDEEDAVDCCRGQVSGRR